MSVKKGWYYAGVWAYESAKKKWEQVHYLEKWYKSKGMSEPEFPAPDVAETHLKGEFKEDIAPAWWNGKCFTLIMWRDKNGKLRKSRRRDHIKAFIKAV